MDELETVLVDFDENTGIGTLTLNRPDSMNALNAQLRSDIITGLEQLESHNTDGVSLRVVVLEAAGEKAFCAGADVNEFSDEAAGGSSERPMTKFIRDFPAPVIAKVHGYCLGGGLETILACDLRYASTDSTLGFPEADLGIIPGMGGIQYASAIAGPAVANELAMTAKRFSGEEADSYGLVNDTFEREDLDEEVEELAETIASKAPLAVQEVKKSTQLSTQVGVEEGVAHDQQVGELLLATEDASEGMTAFAEKRDPEFEGK
ncbi:enoyl-CoA hydratase/isomerase family protein [Halobellus salinisoli]|uniref:enoyl-CoA hydratase/isomerase family protein n=1 Tax=Halobellus salinisoli TaxID=3108500 RepID=UPI0030087D1A